MKKLTLLSLVMLVFISCKNDISSEVPVDPIYFKKGDNIPIEWLNITPGKFSIRKFNQDIILYDGRLFWSDTSKAVITLEDSTEEGRSNTVIKGTDKTPIFYHGSLEQYKLNKKELKR